MTARRIGIGFFVAICLIVLMGLCAWALGLEDQQTPEDIKAKVDRQTIGGAEFVQMTEAEYEDRLRAAGISEEGIERSLANFESDKATLVAHQSQFATPVPREWTAEELVECDISTLRRQMEDSKQHQGQSLAEAAERSKGREKLSDCEVALFSAQLASIAAEEKMDDVEWSVLQEHKVNLEHVTAMTQRYLADGVITPSEGSLACNVVDQQLTQMSEALSYLRSIENRAEWLGLEVDFLRAQRMLVQVAKACP